MSTIYLPANYSIIIISAFKCSIAINWKFDFTGQFFFEFKKYQPLGIIFLQDYPSVFKT
jgi:hypothetical protein